MLLWSIHLFSYTHTLSPLYVTSFPVLAFTQMWLQLNFIVNGASFDYICKCCACLSSFSPFFSVVSSLVFNSWKTRRVCLEWLGCAEASLSCVLTQLSNSFLLSRKYDPRHWSAWSITILKNQFPVLLFLLKVLYGLDMLIFLSFIHSLHLASVWVQGYSCPMSSPRPPPTTTHSNLFDWLEKLGFLHFVHFIYSMSAFLNYYYYYYPLRFYFIFCK